MIPKKLDEMSDEYHRTLYIRLPHTIKDIDEIRNLISCDAKIKLKRQSARDCHVIFPTISAKIKNLKEIRQKKIDNNRVICRSARKKLSVKKVPEARKIKILTPKPAKKITQVLYITNINSNTTKNSLIAALSCRSVAFINKKSKETKKAIVKFSNPELAAALLKEERSWPIVDGNQLILKPDTRKQKKKKPESKIRDDGVDITSNIKFESKNGKEI